MADSEKFLAADSKNEHGRRIRQFDLSIFPSYLFCRVDTTVQRSILTAGRWKIRWQHWPKQHHTGFARSAGL